MGVYSRLEELVLLMLGEMASALLREDEGALYQAGCRAALLAELRDELLSAPRPARADFFTACYAGLMAGPFEGACFRLSDAEGLSIARRDRLVKVLRGMERLFLGQALEYGPLVPVPVLPLSALDEQERELCDELLNRSFSVGALNLLFALDHLRALGRIFADYRRTRTTQS